MPLFKSNPRRLCRIPARETPVQNGLAVTPSQMWELQQSGFPISTQTAGLSFDDGQYKVDWEVPMEHRRGIDPADLFEYQEQMRGKVNEVFGKLSRQQQKSPDNV